MKDSCTWFLRGKVFETWNHCHNSFLWLHGIVGCGKTVLSSAIIEDMKTKECASDYLVLYFYFGSDSAHDCLDGMVRTFLSQIIAATSEIPENLQDRYKSCHQRSTLPETKALLEDFHSAISSLKEVKIVLDALDEVRDEHRDDILSWIEETFLSRENCINLIVLSRHVPVFESRFSRIGPVVPISQEGIYCDLHRYIQTRMREMRVSKQWPLATPEIQGMQSTLLRKTNGM